MKDLFGIETADVTKARTGQPKGYAARPGSGPAGEFCRTCAHARCRQLSKRYWKCALVRATGGPGTDIRLKSPACSYWQPKPHTPTPNE